MALRPSEQILEYIRKNGQSGVDQMIKDLALSRTAIYRELPVMVRNKQLTKIGERPNKVYYGIPDHTILTPPVEPPKPSQESTEPQKSPPSKRIQPKPIDSPSPEPVPAPITVNPEKVTILPTWLNWTLKYNLEAQAITQRYLKIKQFLGEDLASWQIEQGGELAPHHGRTIFMKIWLNFWNSLIWIGSVLSVWVEQKWLARNERNMFWLKIILLILVGAWMGYQFHHLQASRKQQEYGNQTKEQLTSVLSELNRTKEELAAREGDLNQSKKGQGELNRLQEQLENERAKRNDIEQKLREEQKNSRELVAEIRELKGQLSQSQSLVKKLDFAHDQQEIDKRHLKEQIDRGIDQRDEINKEKKELKEDVAAQLKRLQDKNYEINQLHRQIQQLQSKLNAKEPTRPDSTNLAHVTIEQIVQWSKEGKPPAQIIEQIKSSHSTYSLTADDLEYLRRHGVHLSVVDAMKQLN